MEIEGFVEIPLLAGLMFFIFIAFSGIMVIVSAGKAIRKAIIFLKEYWRNK